VKTFLIRNRPHRIRIGTIHIILLMMIFSFARTGKIRSIYLSHSLDGALIIVKLGLVFTGKKSLLIRQTRVTGNKRQTCEEKICWKRKVLPMSAVRKQNLVQIRNCLQDPLERNHEYPKIVRILSPFELYYLD